MKQIVVVIILIICLIAAWFFTRKTQEEFAYEHFQQFNQQASGASQSIGGAMQMAQQLPTQYPIVTRLQQLEQSLSLVARMGYAAFALLQSGGMLVSTAIRTVQGLRMMLERIVAAINQITAIVYKYYTALKGRYFPARQRSVQRQPARLLAPPQAQAQTQSGIGVFTPQAQSSINLESEWTPVASTPTPRRSVQRRNRMSASDRLGRFLGRSAIESTAQALGPQVAPTLNKALYGARSQEEDADFTRLVNFKPF